MIKYYANLILIFMMLILSENLYAQKDVTQFLGIPVDGSKPEMIQELKSKGFSVNPQNDVLSGEFNGRDVNIFIETNNNKVWRIAVTDAIPMNEGDVKIRFNNLLLQFQNNKNYYSTPDSSILKFTIPEDEDISYKMLVNKKSYEADFIQKATDYDSLTLQLKDIVKKSLNDTDEERLRVISAKMFDPNNFNKIVWFKILEQSGKYYIAMFYENKYNKANGEDL